MQTVGLSTDSSSPRCAWRSSRRKEDIDAVEHLSFQEVQHQAIVYKRNGRESVQTTENTDWKQLIFLPWYGLLRCFQDNRPQKLSMKNIKLQRAYYGNMSPAKAAAYNSIYNPTQDITHFIQRHIQCCSWRFKTC